jgi:hypothetical protein
LIHPGFSRKESFEMRIATTLLFVGALLALPAAAEITAKKDHVRAARTSTSSSGRRHAIWQRRGRAHAGGKKALTRWSAITDAGHEKDKVSGHTDNMGKDDNRKLSLRRAEAVRKYLISRDGNFRIDVAGLGETQPLVQCDARKPRAELIRCLAPNRRVEIEKLHD